MTPESVKASYRQAMNDRGETVTHRRYTGAGSHRPHFDADVMAVVSGYQPNEFSGSIVQGDRNIILLAEDLIEAKVPLPITSADKIVVRNKELAIIAVDDSSKRVAGVLIAYVLQVRG